MCVSKTAVTIIRFTVEVIHGDVMELICLLKLLKMFPDRRWSFSGLKHLYEKQNAGGRVHSHAKMK